MGISLPAQDRRIILYGAMSDRRDQVEHFVFAIATAAIGIAAMFVGSVLWPDPPVAGVPIVFSADGGHAVATMTDLTPLKGEYPVHLQMTSGQEIRAIGLSRNELHNRVTVAVSYDNGETFLRLPTKRASSYDDEGDLPYLGVASVHNPQSSTALVRVHLESGLNWPAGMMLVVKNDWLSSRDRERSRITITHFLILGGIAAAALAITVPLWLWKFHRQRLRRVPAAKVSSREDARRLRKELENPRR